jgi:hypothetical protein
LDKFAVKLDRAAEEVDDELEAGDVFEDGDVLELPLADADAA